MSDSNREKILSTVSPDDFVGRAQEVELLLRHANRDGEDRGVLLLSAPGGGASELLKQVYDRIFHGGGKTIPFYFSLRKSDRTAEQAAVRFLQSFLFQTVAFRRRDPNILDLGEDISELAEIALPGDLQWIRRLIAARSNGSRLSDERSFVRNCLSAPQRAFLSGAPVFAMIDNLHEAEYLSGVTDLIEEIRDLYVRSDVPVVLSGRRRFLFGSMAPESFEVVKLEPLSFAESGQLVQRLAHQHGVGITGATRDLIATQLQRSPIFIGGLLKSAGDRGIDLDTFQRVQQVYADEIFGGKISKFFDGIFDEIDPGVETQKHLVSLLFDSLTIERDKAPVEHWQFRTNLDDHDFYRMMRRANIHEVVRITSNLAEPMTENEVLTDYLIARYRLEIAAQSRAVVVGEMLADFLKRAPLIMEKFYRANAALGLKKIMGRFNCQEVPEGILDYAVFRESFRGLSDEEILESAAAEARRIKLPQVVYTADTVSFYPALARLSERERSAVGIGFETGAYTDDDEIVWIAAEFDSKLEATAEQTEFWCDRLEMVAVMCDFAKYRIWLVAPEGFDPEALEILASRNAVGSCKKQVELLQNFLRKDEEEPQGPKNEYEMIVPMGEDTELIAAHALEEIARRHSFSPKAINQIKTALIEASINSTEHSLSPDRKIYQKFTVEDDRLVITVSNRGLRLTDHSAKEIAPDTGRRGWGLKLMRTLMDEVKVEQVDDGTRISMVKYFEAKAG